MENSTKLYNMVFFISSLIPFYQNSDYCLCLNHNCRKNHYGIYVSQMPWIFYKSQSFPHSLLIVIIHVCLYLQNVVLQSLLSDLCSTSTGNVCTPSLLRVQELLTSCKFLPVTTSLFKGNFKKKTIIWTDIILSITEGLLLPIGKLFKLKLDEKEQCVANTLRYWLDF
jgi:hypothetical protein